MVDDPPITNVQGHRSLEQAMVDTVREPVCTENLDSDVLVVQPTDQWTRQDASDPLDRAI
jgi:hypothetical protein